MTKFGWACMAFSLLFAGAMWLTQSPFLIAVLSAMVTISWVYAAVEFIDARKPLARIDDREWRAAQKRRGF
jgi:hypothetical protein